MKDNNNELALIKERMFMLIYQLENNLATHITKNKIDSQGIFALSKLMDSFLKIIQVEKSLGINKEENKEAIIEEDQLVINMYKTKKLEMAPRAGLEPATERLTAACSTTELPGN
jgi:hypothetical protein